MSSDKGAHLDPYRLAVESHGPGFEATLWGTPATQHLRFEIMAELAGGFAGMDVLDLGCGDGALAAWLDRDDRQPAGYVGFDALEAQVHQARQRGVDWARFEVVDVTGPWLETAHWVVCSGTLNTMDESLAREVLEHAWSRCRVGVVFNFLSNRAHRRWLARDTGPARRFETLEWIAWALEQSPLLACRQDYLDGHDVTIAMRRFAPGESPQA